MKTRFLSPARRTAAIPTAAPRKAAPSREETVAELRRIYALLHAGEVAGAKTALVTLGRSLQA